MNFENLTPEQQAKARACKSPEDILALAKEEGYALSDTELETISGGLEWSDILGGITDCTALGH